MGFKTVLVVVCLAALQVIASNETYTTSVDLSKREFRVVEKNVIGTSYGVFFLVAGATPNKAVAVKNLMENAKITPGSNRCLINLNVERRIIFYLLGVVMIETARADVIEFIQNQASEDHDKK
jgi:hypothetical protein